MKKVFFILLSLVLLPSLVFAVDYKVTDKNGNVTIAQDIWSYKDKDSKESMLECTVNEAKVKMPLSKVKSFFITEQSEYKGIGSAGTITLQNGTKGVVSSPYDASFKMMSGFGESEIFVRNLSSIIEKGSDSDIAIQEEALKYDSIQMNNGDLLNGDILTNVFMLKTSYAILEVEKGTVEKINFDGAGQYSTTVYLKAGDKISGSIQNAEVDMSLPMGSQIKLKKNKIKEIRFKKLLK